MKKILSVILPIVLLAGCATNSGDPDQALRRQAALARVTAYVGTYYLLQEKPEARATVEKVSQGLATLKKAQVWDPVQFHAVLQQLPIKELRGTDAAVVIGAASILWREFGVEIPVNDAPRAALFIDAVQSGLQLALEVVP